MGGLGRAVEDDVLPCTHLGNEVFVADIAADEMYLFPDVADVLRGGARCGSSASSTVTVTSFSRRHLLIIFAPRKPAPPMMSTFMRSPQPGFDSLRQVEGRVPAVARVKLPLSTV